MRSMDEVYASLAYDGTSLLRVPVCVSRALLVYFCHVFGRFLVERFYICGLICSMLLRLP